MAIVRRGIVAILILALVTACQAVPSGSPGVQSSAPPASPGASTGSGTASGQPGPTPSTVDSKPSSFDLITGALANGSLDFETALVYRFYAEAGDDRLPAAFAGAGGEDPGGSRVAAASLDQLSPSAREQVLPFLVRPTDPQSWWAPAATGAVGSNVQLAKAQLAAACVDGWITGTTAAPAKVKVWGRCGGQSEATVAAQVDAAVADMEALWEPMTNLMGPPIPDQNIANDRYPDSPEAGDGLIDIYLVDRAVTLHGRDVQTGAEATTREAAPLAGPSGAETASSFIVVNTLTNTGDKLKSTLAHEFFHVLQNAHNDRGMMYRAPGTTRTWLCHWFMEASAVWAEHQFVPVARSNEVYPRFTSDFLPTTMGLNDISSDNEYASFVWPLFMEQEIGPWAIRDAWRAMEGKDGYEPVQAALDAQLSFTDRFRDFAVRVFNADLQPGNPISPLFQALDARFPVDQPGGSRASYNIPILADARLPGFNTRLPSLWSEYWDLVMDPGVKQVTFDFAGLAFAGNVDVDILLLKKGQWSREEGNFEEEQSFCDVEKAIVIVSNHDQNLGGKATGSWNVSALSGGGPACAVGSYSVTLTGPRTGAGSYSGTAQVICSAPTIDGKRYWTTTVVLLTAPFGSLTDFSLQQDPGGSRDTVSATAGGMETGSWFFNSTSPNTTASVTGSGAPGANGLVTGDASFTDSEGRVFTAHISAECSETYY